MANPKPAILIATALGIAAGIAASVRPWAAYGEQREEATAVRADLKEMTAERARLERDAARSNSAIGRETRAREAGYRAPGERDLTLDPESSPSGKNPSGKNEESTPASKTP